MSPALRNSSPDGEQARLSAKKNNLWTRACVIQSIRRFFAGEGYLEVETPYLVPALAPEVHIDPVEAGDLFLHTSPELCMKRLLASGYKKIFQIGKCFRHGERGGRHLPEFTLLEWYRVGIDYKALMEECEALIFFLSEDIGGGPKIRYLDSEIDLRRPWDKMTLGQAFDRYASLTPEEAIKKDCFEEIMSRDIEPHLGLTKPTFLYDYPASLACLARLNSDDKGLAERFELYLGGLEMANGFSELTDMKEQRARFERDSRVRRGLGKRHIPSAEKFLDALAYLPDSAGIALGLDRLVMFFTGCAEIDKVVSFTMEEL